MMAFIGLCREATNGSDEALARVRASVPPPEAAPAVVAAGESSPGAKADRRPVIVASGRGRKGNPRPSEGSALAAGGPDADWDPARPRVDTDAKSRDPEPA